MKKRKETGVPKQHLFGAMLSMMLAMVFSLPSSLYPTISNATESKTSAPTKIRPAVDFRLKQFNGPNTRLLDHRGEVIVLNFWATWCGPCLQELPALEQLYRKYQSNDFTVIGISIDTNLHEIEKFLNDVNISFPALLDTQQEISQLYGVKAMPSTFIIDRDGNVRYEHLGFQPSYLDLYQREIEELIR